MKTGPVLFICLLLTCIAGGCGRVKQMNDEMDRSSALITQNAEAVALSTETVHANIKAVGTSTALIEKNSAMMQELLALMPTIPVKLGIVFLASALLLPSLLLTFSLRKLEKKIDHLFKNQP